MFLAKSSPISASETTETFRLFVLTTETTQPRAQVFSVKVSIICNFTALLTSSVQYGKILPNLVNSSWLPGIMRVILANQKRRNILNE